MALKGFLYLILIFALCFLAVHLIRLAYIGYLSVRKRKAPPPPKQPEKAPEPVYYIVERKRKNKSTYSTPREFEFRK